MAEWSKSSVNFLDVTISLIKDVIETEFYVILQIVINTYRLPRTIF